MATYLLTWNPKKWHWWGDNLEDDFEKEGDMYFGDWSCGNSKNIHTDDRVFLIRLGKEPRGIVASGWADSEVYEDKHWDEELAANGKTPLYTGVRLDTLLDAGNGLSFRVKVWTKAFWEVCTGILSFRAFVSLMMLRPYLKMNGQIFLGTNGIRFRLQSLQLSKG